MLLTIHKLRVYHFLHFRKFVSPIRIWYTRQMNHTSNIRSYKILAIIVGIAASLFYIYDFVIRVMPSAMTHELMIAFQVQAGALGLLSSMFFYGYAPMQIPAGLLFDRFGARKILTVATFLSALATIGFSLTHHLGMAMFYRFVIGFMASFAYIGALKVGSTWFRAKYFAIFASLVQVFGSLGAIMGGGPIAKLTELYGWQNASLIIAFTGIVFTVFIAVIIRDQPPKPLALYLEKQTKANENSEIAFLKIFKNRHIWTTALYGFAIWAPITVFATLWGIPFLREIYTLSSVHAAAIIAMIWIGTAIGGPFLTWFSNVVQKRRLPMIASALLGLISSLIILYYPSLSFSWLAIGLFLFGVSSSSQALCFGLVIDTQPKHLIGTASGFTNMAIILGGLTLQPAVGFILDYFWLGTHTQNGAPIYSQHAYHVALSLVPASFALALLTVLFLIKETYRH